MAGSCHTDGVQTMLGLTEDETTVYRATLRHPERTPAEIAVTCGFTRPKVTRTYGRLAELGLVRRAGDRYRPERPDLAVAARLAEEERTLLARQEALLAARRQVNDLVDTYLAGATLNENAEVLTVQGYPAIRAGLDDFQDKITTRVGTINFGLPHPDDYPERQANDRRLLARGIEVRTIMPSAALDDPRQVANLVTATELGEQNSLMPQPPMTLIVYDRSLAVIPVDQGDVSRGALFIRSAGIAFALTQLFELAWSVARPFVTGTVVAETALGPRDRQLLALMSAGLNDEAIARQVGFGLRTVRRDIARLLEELGARSRFEAGVLASRRGWL